MKFALACNTFIHVAMAALITYGAVSLDDPAVLWFLLVIPFCGIVCKFRHNGDDDGVGR